MEITSITPAVKIVKESSMAGSDMNIAFGDNVKITTHEGKVFTGIFLYMDLGKGEEEDDALVLDIGDQNMEIQCSWIVEIEEV